MESLTGQFLLGMFAAPMVQYSKPVRTLERVRKFVTQEMAHTDLATLFRHTLGILT
jgi:hypothetical protein